MPTPIAAAPYVGLRLQADERGGPTLSDAASARQAKQGGS
tara:strand:+ start:237 stop:356 length:120 start_codon:yes stop_codon:yes gene_type:complete